MNDLIENGRAKIIILLLLTGILSPEDYKSTKLPRVSY